MSLHTEDEVIDILNDMIEQEGSVPVFALKNDVCSEMVRLIIKRQRPPTGNVLKAAGFRKVIRYEKIEDEG
jgi:hypothetical protein